jgi:hypothetical protein
MFLPGGVIRTASGPLPRGGRCACRVGHKLAAGQLPKSV